MTPEAEELLNAIMAALTTEELSALNAEVDVERADPEDVATTWLEDNGSL